MLKKYWKNFISLIYPNNCLNCSIPLVQGEETICLRCFSDLPIQYYHQSNPNPIVEKLSGYATVRNGYCLMKYSQDGIAQKLLHELKYKSNPAVGVQLGEWLVSAFEREFRKLAIDLIIPIPIHKIKKRNRGFNQSEIIAEGMANELKVKVSNNLLIRTKNKSSQTKKGKITRIKNVLDVYAISNGNESLEGKSILILDDVITTGATTGAAAELLEKNGADKIYVACIAMGQ